MLQPERMPMEEMPQAGMPMEEGPDEAEESITGLLAASQFLAETIVGSPDIPEDLKREVATVTEQYVSTITKVLAGPQGGAQPMETIPGARPVTPQGM